MELFLKSSISVIIFFLLLYIVYRVFKFFILLRVSALERLKNIETQLVEGTIRDRDMIENLKGLSHYIGVSFGRQADIVKLLEEIDKVVKLKNGKLLQLEENNSIFVQKENLELIEGSLIMLIDRYKSTVNQCLRGEAKINVSEYESKIKNCELLLSQIKKIK